jgi:hypothetical protein
MCLATLLYGSAGLAAERVVLKYGILRDTISVAELTEFAKTGKRSPDLEAYMRMTKVDSQAVQRSLTREVPFDPVILDRVLNSPFGDVLLDRIGEAIHTPSNTANRQALRAALTLSAKDGKVSLLEAIQNYPTQEVYVEGENLLKAYTQLSEAEEKIQGVLGKIKILLP